MKNCIVVNKERSIMLHGHSHGALRISRFRIMDVGVDTNDELKPYNFQHEIVSIMSKRKNRNHHPDTFIISIKKQILRIIKRITK